MPGRRGSHHPAEAKPGSPHVVRIGTDTFLRREKCPKCSVRWGWAGRSALHKAGRFIARAARGPGKFWRGVRRVPVRRRTLGFEHFALRPKCSSPGALRGGSAASGSAFIVRRGREEQAEAPAFRPRPGSTGTPPLVRIRTDTFLRREKCPRCRVRGCVSPGGRKRNGNAACGGAGPGEARSVKAGPFYCPGGAGAAGSFAQNGRVPVRRRTRRFGHAALASCSVFAPRRTTRRQRRALLGFHRAAGEEKPARAPPCPAGWNLRQNLLQWNHDTPRPRRARKGLRPVAARLSPALWPGRNTTPPPRLRAAAQRRI